MKLKEYFLLGYADTLGVVGVMLAGFRASQKVVARCPIYHIEPLFRNMTRSKMVALIVAYCGEREVSLSQARYLSADQKVRDLYLEGFDEGLTLLMSLPPQERELATSQTSDDDIRALFERAEHRETQARLELMQTLFDVLAGSLRETKTLLDWAKANEASNDDPQVEKSLSWLDAVGEYMHSLELNGDVNYKVVHNELPKAPASVQETYEKHIVCADPPFPDEALALSYVEELKHLVEEYI